MGWIRSCLGIFALWGLSSPALGGQILMDTFNETGFPKNWTQLPGTSGVISVVSSGHLVMTDSQGGGAVIYSSLNSSTFNPVGVTTTDTVHINSVSTNPIGNAIFGFIGLTAGGELAAGIDSTDIVFVVETDLSKNLNQKIVQLGKDTTYTGGATNLTLIIDSTGLEVNSSGFKSGHQSFSSDLNGFTLESAFGGAATPALVGASQPGQTGGAANFGSITVSTLAGSAAVPEPSGLITLGIGVALLGVIAAIRRKTRVAG